MDQRVFVTRHRPKLERFQKRTTILKTADRHTDIPLSIKVEQEKADKPSITFLYFKILRDRDRSNMIDRWVTSWHLFILRESQDMNTLKERIEAAKTR